MTNRPWQQAVAAFGQRMPAPVLLIVAIVIIQISSGIAKTIMSADNITGLALFRVVLGTVLIWAVVRPPVRGLSKSQWIDVGLLGVAFALLNLTAYAAMVRLPLGLAVTIAFLGPLTISLVTSRRVIDFVWPILGFAGVYLLSPSNQATEISWTSVGYGFAYAASWAAYILASARAARTMNGLDGFVLAGAVTAILLLPFGYSTVGDFVSGGDVFLAAFIATVLLTTAFGLEFVTLKRMEARVFGVLLSLEPAIASIIGMIMLREFLSPTSWFAIAIVSIAASGAAMLKKSQRVA